MVTLVLHIHRELIHHLAEIALLRDLYRQLHQPEDRPDAQPDGRPDGRPDGLATRALR